MSAGAGFIAPGALQLDSFEGEALVQVRVPARSERLRIVRKFVEQVATLSGCGEACARDMVIAIDEACQNVIRHAYGGEECGEFVLDIRRSDDRLIFNLIDFAEPVDLSLVRPRNLDELRPGGLGTHFIRECMDEAGFLAPPEGAGNRLQMSKRIE